MDEYIEMKKRERTFIASHTVRNYFLIKMWRISLVQISYFLFFSKFKILIPIASIEFFSRLGRIWLISRSTNQVSRLLYRYKLLGRACKIDENGQYIKIRTLFFEIIVKPIFLEKKEQSNCENFFRFSSRNEYETIVRWNIKIERIVI